jgi:tight adherence protein B
MRVGRDARSVLAHMRRILWGRERISHGRELELRAEAVRSLAASLRGGLSPRQALTSWRHHAPEALAPPLLRLARRLALGDRITNAVAGLQPAWEQDALAVAGVFAVGVRAGGDLATMLDGVASAIDARRIRSDNARAAGAGARLSGRLVAGLPLVFVPLAPLSRAPLFDGPGIVLSLAGAGLAVVGMAWIGRLVPRPDSSDDGPAQIAEWVACVVKGGASVPGALDAIAEHPPAQVASSLGRARRLFRLGLGWTEALGRCGDEGLAELAATMSDSHRLGLPAAASLDDFAARRRAARAREFEIATKRAPVLMMIPLALCVLPSFVLLGLGPFLRGLSFG